MSSSLKPPFMQVKINFKDGKVKYTRNVTQRKFSATYRALERENATFEGSVIVDYGNGYKNEFDFNNKEELMDKMSPCLEKELIDEFRG